MYALQKKPNQQGMETQKVFLYWYILLLEIKSRANETTNHSHTIRPRFRLEYKPINTMGCFVEDAL